jgi:hypothetical protein
MMTPRLVYSLMVADFLERVRRYSFLIVVLVTVYAGYSFLPPLGSSYTALVIGGCRGFYNSPWVGTVFGMVATVTLSLVGFYLVKGAIERDHDTRVGQILAATPLDRVSYVLGKWLSNVAVLALVLVVLSVMAPIMQLVRGEDTHIDLLALWAPIWLMGLPTSAIVAACAVLMESIAVFRRGLINVVFFFVWLAAMLLCVGRPFLAVETLTPGNDPAGLSRTMVSMREQMTAEGYDVADGITDIYVPTQGDEVTRFHWEGANWDAATVAERSSWLGLALVLVLVAAVPFDRFDPAVRGIRSGRKSKTRQPSSVSAVNTERLTDTGSPCPPAVAHDHLTPLPVGATRAGFAAALAAELRLLMCTQKMWWFAVLMGLNIATLVDPSDNRARLWFAFAWLWPMLIWSSMGSRERMHRMQSVMYSIAHPIGRLLPAIWLSGVVVAAVAGAGYAARLMIYGQADHLIGWMAGALFVPSLALALGVVTNSNRLFEIIYLAWWYLGIGASVSVFDFKGTTDAAIVSAIPLYYLIGAVALAAIAVIARPRQMALSRT